MTTNEIEGNLKEGRKLVKYVPMMDGKAWITPNTVKHGGLCDQEEFKKAVEMLEEAAHTFRNPRLFHICFTGADDTIYSRVRNRLCRLLKENDVDVCWKAALESDSDKGTHYHLMIVLGTSKQTYPYIRTGKESSGDENESLLHKAVRETWDECATLNYRVNPTRTGAAFIQFNQTNMVKFNDAVDWFSYIYKKRSKGAGKGKSTFFSSRKKRSKLAN